MAYMNKSKSDNYQTPQKILDDLYSEFGNFFDPCPINCDLKIWNGLDSDWSDVNFVNPPYSELKLWIKKCWEQWKKGKTVILLIPSRTDTIAFHEYIYGQAEIRFLKGRLKFIYDSIEQQAAPFPSMLVIFKRERTIND